MASTDQRTGGWYLVCINENKDVALLDLDQ